jgi:hypothetical protein
MVDYFDAKVDLQAFVFEEHTPDSELILDLLDGLPSYMLPTLKASISPHTTLLEFRRTLLDYEKGLRWDGSNELNDNPYDPKDGNDAENDENQGNHQIYDDDVNEDNSNDTDSDNDSSSGH